MAAQRLHHICVFLLACFLVEGAKAPCEPHLRSRKPPLDSLHWEAYWVPLMIILGGCCAMAWSILFIAYDMGQRGRKMLPQIPSAEEEGVPGQGTPKEMNEGSNPVESKGSKEWGGNQLETKASREGIGNQLDRRGSREQVENQLEIKGSREGIANQLDRRGSREGTENQLEIKGSAEGIGSLLERGGSAEGIGHPSLQGGNEPGEADSQRCGKLWAVMEKELERLLQLLRFCRSSCPSPLAEEPQAPPGEEATALPATEAPDPPAEETPPPAPVQEAPTVPAEEMPRPPGSREGPPVVHLIICELPPSAGPSRGRRRRGGSRGRK